MCGWVECNQGINTCVWVGSVRGEGGVEPWSYMCVGDLVLYHFNKRRCG